MEKSRIAKQADIQIQLKAQNILIQVEIARRDAEPPPTLVNRAHSAPTGWRKRERNGLRFEVPPDTRGKHRLTFKSRPGQSVRLWTSAFERRGMDQFQVGGSLVDLNRYRKQSPHLTSNYRE